MKPTLDQHEERRRRLLARIAKHEDALRVLRQRLHGELRALGLVDGLHDDDADRRFR